jgi:outer membrane protein OmpA-like peptidoglycan-associated protein
VKRTLFALYIFSIRTICFSQNVQWVSKILEVSSEFSSKQNSAGQVIGPPNVFPQGGMSSCAWQPAGRSNKEFIKIGFRKSIKPSQVIIAENLFPGSVSKIYLIDKQGKEHLVKKLKTGKPEEPSRLLHVPLDKVDFETTSMKVELHISNMDELPQIDAIGITDGNEPYVPKINLINLSLAPTDAINLGDHINTEYKEVAPVISPDNKVLYFTRDSPENIGGKNQDIWYSEIDSSLNFSKAKNLGFPINNDRNNYASAITPDGQTMLVGNIYLEDGSSGGSGLSISRKIEDRWAIPEKLNIRNYNNRGKYTSAFLANDGKTLLVAITRDDTYGGEDLYVCFQDKNGNWSQPLNLGPKLNTASDEYTPFLASDMTTLYFTSEGWPGFGIGDIYMSKRLDNTWKNWSEPVNLGQAFNTVLSDFYFTIPASGDYAYFVSSAHSKGATDLFRIKLPLELQPSPVVLIKGRVLNAKTKAPIPAEIYYEMLPQGDEKGKANADGLGRYKIVLPAGSLYGFRASHPGFISINENIDVRETKKYTEIDKDLLLVPIEVGQIVRINNLFFSSNKSFITDGSFPELNRLAETMKQNPKIEIEISGHTDDIGSEQDNLKLSEERAKKVLFYLYEKGVEFARMQAKGYGEGKPLLPNTSEENRQQNRRVEFTIRKK